MKLEKYITEAGLVKIDMYDDPELVKKIEYKIVPCCESCRWVGAGHRPIIVCLEQRNRKFFDEPPQVEAYGYCNRWLPDKDFSK